MKPEEQHQRDHLEDDILSFQGIGRGLWGGAPALVDATVQQVRDGWDRPGNTPADPTSTRTN